MPMRTFLALLPVYGLLLIGCGGSNTTTTNSTVAPPQGNQPLSQQATDIITRANQEISQQSASLSSGLLSCLKKQGTQAKKDCTVTYFKQIKSLYDRMIPAYQQALDGAQGACRSDLQDYLDMLKGVSSGMGKFIAAAESGSNTQAQNALQEMLKSISGVNLKSAGKLVKDCQLTLKVAPKSAALTA